MHWKPAPVFLPGKFHGQRSLVDYSPLDHKESDKTEWLSTVQAPVMAAPPCPDATSDLTLPWVSQLYPYLRLELSCEASGAGVFTWHMGGSYRKLARCRSSFQSALSPFFGSKQSVQASLMSKIWAFHSLLLVRLALQPREEAYLLCFRPQGRGIVILRAHCEEDLYPCIQFSLWVPPRGLGPDLINFSLPAWFLWVFLTALARSFSVSLQSVFSENCSSVDVFLMYSWGEVCSASSYSAIFISTSTSFTFKSLSNMLGFSDWLFLFRIKVSVWSLLLSLFLLKSSFSMDSVQNYPQLLLNICIFCSGNIDSPRVTMSQFARCSLGLCLFQCTIFIRIFPEFFIF